MTKLQKVLYGAANPGCKVSGGKAASALIVTGSGVFHGLIVKCDGTNDVTVNVYDNTAASGTQLIPTDSVFDGTIKLNSFSASPGIWFATGLYLKIVCSGTTEIMVLYDDDAIVSVH